MTQTATPPRKRRLPKSHQIPIWRNYLETSEMIRSRLASRLQSDSGLSMGDYQVLLALTEADDNRLRSSELAAQITWERSRLSHHLGRMEKRGLIRREPCPDDSRGADVVLSDQGENAFRTASIPHLQAVREVFMDALTPKQLSQLEEITAGMRAHLDSVDP